MVKTLAAKPNLRNLKNQAKSLLKAQRLRDPSVCATLRLLRRFGSASDDAIFDAKVSLTEAQYALAMDYGFNSWNDLRNHVESVTDPATNARAAVLFEKALKHYTAKGPAHDNIGSIWWQGFRDILDEIAKADEAGYLANLQLAASDRGKVRREAAVHFGVRADARSREQLLRLMQDKAAMVRKNAMLWYAGVIHPDTSDGPVEGGTPASRLPDEGIDALLPMVDDPDVKVRMAATRLLGAYVHLSPKARKSVEEALNDSQHEVRHTAARVLDVACPGCGATPLPFAKTDPAEAVRWQEQLYQRHLRNLHPGEEGFQRNVELSHSDKAKEREAAAIYFALRADARCREHLERLLTDVSAMVRRQALRSYAILIHPRHTEGKLYCIGMRATSVPAGINRLLPCQSDSNSKNRRVLVEILQDYADVGDERIDHLLHEGKE